MRNPLQDQLLKAGLVKKAQVAQVVRDQAKQKQAKQPPAPTDQQRSAEHARTERVARDRALAAERNAQARLHEQQAQAKQIMDANRIATKGETDYRFTDDGVIRSVRVDAALRSQLASGAVVIARDGERYALLPRAAGEKVRARAAGMIVVDHGAGTSPTPATDDDGYYAAFPVPDDLMW